MRILCYAQHLSGVGHFVRIHALACGLAQAHDVLLVDGGWPVPRLPSPSGLTLLPLPRLHRRAGALSPLGAARPIAAVREERVRRLVAAVAGAPPDVVIIEHYPWSKWELEEEILAIIGATRRARPAVRVVCSLRDVAPRTRHEPVSEDEYERRVLDRLAAHFDAVLIHADPRFARLDEYFSGAGRLPIPCEYTGFVCAGTEAGVDSSAWQERPYAVLSAGGGAQALPFLRATIEAFRRLSSRGDLGTMRLMVFAGLLAEEATVGALAAEARDRVVAVRPFSPDFPMWLGASELSISQAGYNTCAELLSAGVPAALVPDPLMSDQRIRAERMRAHGLATLALGDPPPVEALVGAIQSAYRELRPCHSFGLRGVEETRTLLERLHRTGRLGDDYGYGPVTRFSPPVGCPG